VHHSDRGIKYTKRLVEAGVKPSVGGVDDSYDNALAETINGLYKSRSSIGAGLEELRSGRIRPFGTGRLVQSRRLLEEIGNIPPAEAGERYHARLHEHPWPEMPSGKPGAV